MSVATATVTDVVKVGDAVLTSHGLYIWKGEADTAGMNTISFNLRDGGLPGIHTDKDQVAPASVEALVNLKDSRISVTKQPENRPVTWVGPWRAHVVGEETKFSSWHRTKKEGVQEMARRLAIRDWHEAGGVVNN